MSNLSEWAARFGNDVILRRLEHDSDVAGRLRQSGYFGGKYHDTTIYEILF